MKTEGTEVRKKSRNMTDRLLLPSQIWENPLIQRPWEDFLRALIEIT